jgi:flagellar motor switch protein FliG
MTGFSATGQAMAETKIANGTAGGQIDGTKKAAALLLAMGKPLADRLLKYFSEAEIQSLVETMTKLGSVPRGIVDDLVDEIAAAVEAGADIRGSSEDAEQLLAGILTPEQLASIMTNVRSQGQRSVWTQLADVPEPTVTQYLAREHPQIAAFVLAKAGPNMAAAVLRQSTSSIRTELVRRVLAIRPVTELAQGILEHSMRDELLVKISKETGPPVHSRVADIINKMERQQMEEVLNDLESKRPKDAKVVKGLLFTFDDIARLSAADRVKLFDGVPVDRTILALQGAPPALKEFILASVSSRSRRMIEQEVAGGGNAPPRDVLKARRLIADLALELAERGQIEIAQQEAEPV